MDIAGLIIAIIFLIPIYGMLIFTYIDSEESFLIGRRWMYEEEPEMSEEAIEYYKKVSLISIIVLTFFVILTIYRSF